MKLERKSFFKKDPQGVFLRAVILILIPLLLTIFIFLSICLPSSKRISVITGAQSNPIKPVSGQEINLPDFIERLSWLTKLPPLFLNFNVYVENHVVAQTWIGEDLNTVLNVKILNNYKEVNVGERAKLYGGLNIQKLEFQYERSLKTSDPSKNSLLASSTLKKDSDYFLVFIRPTVSSFVFLLLALVALTYATIVFVSFCLKFILLGSPILDVLKEFKETKGMIKEKAIIFDADGMVVSGERFSARFSREFNIPMGKLDKFFSNEFKPCIVGKADLKEAITPYLKEWNYTGTIDELLRFWFAESYALDMVVADFIMNARKKGIKCILATNQEKYRVAFMRKDMGFEQLFDAVVASSDVGVKKPDPIFFDHLMQLLPGLNKEEVLFFDDRPENISGAETYGFQAKLYTHHNDLLSLEI